MTRPAVTFDWLNGDARELQARYEQAFALPMPARSAWMTCDDREVMVRALVHQPDRPGSAGGCIVYFHGGGWIVGSPLTHADIVQALCDATGMRVFSVEYRLAPQHPAPAPVMDGLVVLSHVLAEAGCARAFLCGDSAGAAIALAVERAATPALREKLCGIAALYGFYGQFDDAKSRQWGSREEGLDEASMRRYWRLANPPDGQSPYTPDALASSSPVPVYLLAAGADPLCEDTIALAQALRAANRDVTIERADGEPHGFLHKVKESASASAAVVQLADWIASNYR